MRTKAQRFKSLCIKIAKVIADNKELFSKLERTRNIPKTELLKLLKINKKTIERNRTFIIAAALIFGNDFNLLKDFLDISEPGGDNIDGAQNNMSHYTGIILKLESDRAIVLTDGLDLWN